MNEPTLRELLTEVAEAVEPGEHLDAIRARTRRPRTHLWVPAGAALVAASVVGAVALSGGPADRVAEPGPGSGTSGSPLPTSSELPDAVARPVPIYFVGDTPDGPRLFREFQRGDGPESAEMFALRAAVQGGAIDPDYRTLWPAGTSIDYYSMHSGGEILVDVTGDLHDRPAGMSPAEAHLAVQQLVYTGQGLLGEGRFPVTLYLNGGVTDQLLGVPTSEPVANAPVLATLAHVSLSSPSEGRVVDNDDALVVRGVGNSYEGNIVTELQTPDGTEVVEPTPAIAGWQEDRLFPFEVTLDLSDVPPGEYVVRSQTDDPSGNQRWHVDTRTITVVD